MTVEAEDVMSIGDRLLDQYPGTFTAEFGHNKSAVGRLTDIGSIQLRNRVAGYITRKRQGRSADGQ